MFEELPASVRYRFVLVLVAAAAAAACSDSAAGAPHADPGGSPGGASSSSSTSAVASSAGPGSGAGGDGGSDVGAGAAGGAGGAGGDYGFYGPSRCDAAGVSLCDGFESGALDTSVWTKTTTAGTTITVDKMHAARGEYALHVHSSNVEKTNGYIKEKMTFPAAQNRFYGRAFVYLEANVPTNNFNYFSASGPGSTYNLGGTTTPFGSPTGEHFIRFNYQPLDIVSKSAEKVPVDGWNCWEWYFKGDDPNELHFWLDEVELTDMTVIEGTKQGQWVAPDFDTMSFGFHHAHPEPAPSYEVWIDEVAVDAARIGCSK